MNIENTFTIRAYRMLFALAGMKANNSDEMIQKYVDSDPEMASKIAINWLAKPDRYSKIAGISTELITQLGRELFTHAIQRGLSRAAAA